MAKGKKIMGMVIHDNESPNTRVQHNMTPRAFCQHCGEKIYEWEKEWTNIREFDQAEYWVGKCGNCLEENVFFPDVFVFLEDIGYDRDKWQLEDAREERDKAEERAGILSSKKDELTKEVKSLKRMNKKLATVIDEIEDTPAGIRNHRKFEDINKLRLKAVTKC